MNKTLSIGLAGFSFVIEEHAYIKLSDYLSALRTSLDSTEADEVMHDIEIRMVEIFRDLLGKREVINNEDVERVIAQIGTPEAIEEQEEAYYSESTKKQKSTFRDTQGNTKQLFRNPEDSKIAGVCSGLALYVGIDSTWMRVIWVLLFFALIPMPGSPFLIVLIYVILWAILPVAQSTSDILKMKGKPVNFDTIKEESSKIVQFANESTQKVGEMYHESKPAINKAGSGIWNILRYVIGAFFALLSFSTLMGAFFGFAFLANADFPGINQMNFYFDNDRSAYLLSGIIVIGSLIPAIIFGIIATKLISPQTKLKNIGWVLGGLFMALIAIGTYFGLTMAKNDIKFSGHKEETEELVINTNSDTLIVDVKNVNIPATFKAYDNDIYSDKKSVYDEDYIEVKVVRKSEISKPYLIIKREAKGYNHPMNISVPVEISGNKIFLPNFVKYPYAERFRNYRVDYELVVPTATVIISKNKNKIHYDGDVDGDGLNDRDQNDDEYDSDNNSIEINDQRIKINGKTITFDSDDKDSIIINNKKYSKKEARLIMDSVKNEIKLDPRNIDIKIGSGDKQISIKNTK